MLIVFIWTCVIYIGIVLFQKGAGTLNPCRINIISLVFYFLLLQTILGALLTSLGYTKHYTYLRLENPEKFAQLGEIYSVLTFLLFPIIVIIVLKVFKVDPKKEYDRYLNEKIQVKNSSLYFYITLVASLISSFFLIVLLKKIGYIPIIKLFFN